MLRNKLKQYGFGFVASLILCTSLLTGLNVYATEAGESTESGLEMVDLNDGITYIYNVADVEKTTPIGVDLNGNSVIIEESKTGSTYNNFYLDSNRNGIVDEGESIVTIDGEQDISNGLIVYGVYEKKSKTPISITMNSGHATHLYGVYNGEIAVIEGDAITLNINGGMVSSMLTATYMSTVSTEGGLAVDFNMCAGTVPTLTVIQKSTLDTGDNKNIALDVDVTDTAYIPTKFTALQGDYSTRCNIIGQVDIHMDLAEKPSSGGNVYNFYGASYTEVDGDMSITMNNIASADFYGLEYSWVKGNFTADNKTTCSYFEDVYGMTYSTVDGDAMVTLVGNTSGSSGYYYMYGVYYSYSGLNYAVGGTCTINYDGGFANYYYPVYGSYVGSNENGSIYTAFKEAVTINVSAGEFNYFYGVYQLDVQSDLNLIVDEDAIIKSYYYGMRYANVSGTVTINAFNGNSDNNYTYFYGANYVSVKEDLNITVNGGYYYQIYGIQGSSGYFSKVQGNVMLDIKNVNEGKNGVYFGYDSYGAQYANVEGNLKICAENSNFYKFIGDYYCTVGKNLVTEFDTVCSYGELYGAQSYGVGGTVTNTMTSVTATKLYGFRLDKGTCVGDVKSTITDSTASSELYGVTTNSISYLFTGMIDSTIKNSSAVKAYAIYKVETNKSVNVTINGGTYGPESSSLSLFGAFDLYTPEITTIDITDVSVVGNLTPYKAYEKADNGDVTIDVSNLTIQGKNQTASRITNTPYNDQKVHMTIEDSTLPEDTQIVPGSDKGIGTAIYNGAMYYAGKILFDEDVTYDTIYLMAGHYHIPKGNIVKANKAIYFKGGQLLLEGILDGEFQGIDSTTNQYPSTYVYMNGGTLSVDLSTIANVYYPLDVTSSEIGGTISNSSTTYAKYHAMDSTQMYGRVGSTINYRMTPIKGYQLNSAKVTSGTTTTDLEVVASGGTFGFTMPGGPTTFDIGFGCKQIVLGKTVGDPILKQNQEYTTETPVYDLTSVTISNDSEDGEVTFAVDETKGLPTGLELSEDGTKIVGTPTALTEGTKASIWVIGKNGSRAELILNIIVSVDGTGEQTSQDGRITVDEENKVIYLSGNSVVLEQAASDETTVTTAIYLDDNGDGEADYDTAVATGVYSDYTIYGVANTECNNNVRITMNGGSVGTIYGAYYGSWNKRGSTLEVYVTGGTVKTLQALNNSSILGTAKMVVNSKATVTSQSIVSGTCTYDGYYVDNKGAVNIQKTYTVDHEINATSLVMNPNSTITLEKPVTVSGSITISGSSSNTSAKVIFKDTLTATSSTLSTNNYVTTTFNGDVEVAKITLNSPTARATTFKGKVTATDITFSSNASATFAKEVDITTMTVGTSATAVFNGTVTATGAITTSNKSKTTFNKAFSTTGTMTVNTGSTVTCNDTFSAYTLDTYATMSFNKDVTVTSILYARASSQLWINPDVTAIVNTLRKYTDSKIYLKGTLQATSVTTGSSYYGHIYMMEGGTLGTGVTWTYVYYPITTSTDLQGTNITLAAITATNMDVVVDGGVSTSYIREGQRFTVTEDTVPGYTSVVSMNGEAISALIYMPSRATHIEAAYVPKQITLEKSFADPEGVVGTEYTAIQPLYALNNVKIIDDTTASYGGEVSYAINKDSALPEGLTLDEDGNIIGTPTVADTEGTTVKFDIKGRNGTTATVEVKIILHEEGYEMVDINKTITGTTSSINLNGTPVVICGDPNNSSLCSIYPDYDGDHKPDNNIAFRIGNANSYNLSSCTIYGYNNVETPYEGDFTISLLGGTVSTIYGVKGTSENNAVVEGNVGVYVHGGTVKNTVYGAYYGTVENLDVEAIGGTHTYTDFTGAFYSTVNGDLNFECGKNIIIYGGASETNRATVYGAWGTTIAGDANITVGAVDYAHGLTSPNAATGNYQERMYSRFRGLYSASVSGNCYFTVDGYWYPREMDGNYFAYSSSVGKNMDVHLRNATISNANRAVETYVAYNTTIGEDLKINAEEGSSITTSNEFYALSGSRSSAANVYVNIPDSCNGQIGYLIVLDGSPTVEDVVYSNNNGYVEIGGTYAIEEDLDIQNFEIYQDANVTIMDGVTVTTAVSNLSKAEVLAGATLINRGTLNLQTAMTIAGTLDNYGTVNHKSKLATVSAGGRFINHEDATWSTYTLTNNGTVYNNGTFTQSSADVSLGTIYTTKPLTLLGENSTYVADSNLLYPVKVLYPENCVSDVSLAEESVFTTDILGDQNQYIEGGTAFVLTVGDTLSNEVELSTITYGSETASQQSDGTWTGTVPFEAFTIELVYEATEGVTNIELETTEDAIENTQENEMLVVGKTFDAENPLYDLNQIGVKYDSEEEGVVQYIVETNSTLPAGLTLENGKLVGTLEAANSEEQVVKFIVKGKNQTTATFTLTIGAIKKMIPSWSVPTGFSAKVGYTFSQVKLPTSTLGTYSWPDATATVSKEATTLTGVELLFTPKDIVNYDWATVAETVGAVYEDGVITCNVTIEVSAGIPTYVVPTNVTATYGQTLGQVEIPSGNNDGVFTWTDKSYTSVGDAGVHYFNAKYTPNDKNYETVSGISIKVVVEKAEASYEPLESISATCGQTLNDITLPGVVGGQYQWITLKNTVPENGASYVMGYKPNDVNNYNWEAIKGWDATWGMVKFNVVVNLTHNYQEEWTYDEEQHWHACVTDGCSEKSAVSKHEWDDGTIEVPATEETTGLKKYTCACGATKTEILPVLTHTNHIYSEEWKHNSTSHWHECTIDDCSSTTTPVAHEWDEGVVITPATELAEGSMKYTCVCGTTKTEVIEKLEHTNHTYGNTWKYDEDNHWKECTFEGCEETTTKTAHVWGEGVVTKPATETTEGTKKYTCTCGKTKTEVIEKLEHTNHTYGNTWKYDEDNHWKECTFTNCEETTTKTAHVWDEGVVTKPATEEVEGITTYTCECGATKTEILPVLTHTNHIYAEEWKYNSTSHWHVCTIDDCSSTTAPVAHTWDDGVVITPATETSEGSMKYTCECGATKTEVIEKLEHTKHIYGDTWKYDENNHCKECTFEGCEETTTKTAHEWDEGVVTVEPTETNEGSMKYTCECGATKTEVIEKLEHTKHIYGDTWKYDENNHWKECTFEGCEETTTETAHEWDEGVVIVEPTETSEGSMKYTCECGATKIEVIEKLEHTKHIYGDEWKSDEDTHWQVCTFEGCEETTTPEEHTWDEEEIVTLPTEEADGLKQYTCKCGVTKNEIMTALPHSDHTYDDEWKYNTKTHWHECTFEGCSGVTIPEEHVWDEGKVLVEPTELSEGAMEYTCECGATKTEPIEKLEHTNHVYGEEWESDKDTHWHVCTFEGCTTTSDPEVHTWDDREVEKPATETEEGSMKYTCKCGEMKTSPIDKLPHTVHQWDEGEVVTPATEMTQGTMKYTCKVCRKTKTEVIEALEHTNHVYSTIWSFDEDAHWHACLTIDCDEVSEEQEHQYGTPEIVVQATEDDEGTKKYSCQTCDYSYTEQYDLEESEIDEPLEVDEEFEDEESGITYVVTSDSEIGFVKMADESATELLIPKSVTFGGKTYTVTSIEDEAFKNHKTLKKIVIGEHIKSIGKKAFYGCKKLTTVTIGANVITIGESAFQNCIALKKITIPSSVKTIGKKAFYGCKKLATVNMGKNVETIGNSAFQNCTVLKKIEIPSKVKKIGSKAFYNCKALTSIKIKTTKLNTSKVGSKAFTKAGSKNYKKLVVKVPKSKLKAYKPMLKKRGLSTKAKVKK